MLSSQSRLTEARIYNNLQALRALAAIAVTIFHLGLLPVVGQSFPIGAAGVDLFFVLSGFVIAYSASRNSTHFLWHRLARVLPPYWIATLIAALFAFPNVTRSEFWGWLEQSLLMLPGPGGRPALIFVAWTLVYELAFYLFYWTLLRLSRARAPYLAIGVLIALASVRLPFGFGPWPLLAEFAIGIGIFLVIQRSEQIRHSQRAGLALLLTGLALIPVMPTMIGHQVPDHEGLSRVPAWGMPSALLVGGGLLMERGGWAVANRALLLLGAASYALNLLHPVVVGQLFALPPSAECVGLMVGAAATLLCIISAAAFHLIIERPLYQRLRRLRPSHQISQETGR